MNAEPEHLLSPEILASLPVSVRRPGYDRQGLGIGMAHIGVGAFHRCHQGDFTDDMLEARFDRWGVVGINLKPPRLADGLARQSGLYTRTLVSGGEADIRVVGCMRQTIDVEAGDAGAAIAALADPDVSVVTLTITEKGYCHVPATGQIDTANQEVAADLREPGRPRTALGLLAAGLDRRRTIGAAGLTLVSCDNIPANGRILANVLTEFALQRSPTLAGWIGDNVRFPSTMVDRIVPATSPADAALVVARCGVVDLAPVVGEPFRQWVIEDNFATRRPDWDAAGAEFAADVTPYELMKMRLLNATQSAFAYFGILSGKEHTVDAARDPVIGGVVRKMLVSESAATLPVVPGTSASVYIDQVLRRLDNTALRHRNHQVATDGSQKIVQRLLNPIRGRIGKSQSFELLAAVVAGWIAYLLAAAPRYGARWPVADPFANEVQRVADRAGANSRDIAGAVLAIKPVFGNDLATGPLAAVVARHLEHLLAADPRGYLATL
jgi:fructuronate reductase